MTNIATQPDFSLAQGDLRPVIREQLDGGSLGVNGSLSDLTTATAVRFRMRPSGAATWKVDAAGTIIDAANRIVEYDWSGTDTDTPGEYDYCWVVTWPGSKPETFPNDSFNRLLIRGFFGAFWPTPDDLASTIGTTFASLQDTAAQYLLDDIVSAFCTEADHNIKFISGDARKLRGNWTSDLWLPEPPVTNVSAVHIDVPGGIDFDLSSDHYDWRRSGLVRRVIGFPPAGVLRVPVIFGWWGGDASEITVTYDHGFTTIPGDVRRVILQAAKRRWANPDSFEAEDVGDYHAVYARTTDPRALFTDEELAIARRYSRMTGPPN